MAGSDNADNGKANAKVAVFRARQLLKEKRYADALQVCTDELARGRDDPQLRLIAAHSLMAQGRHEGAKKEAQLVIRLDSRQPEAYRILADVACTRGELATACEHLERVLELSPNDEKSRSLLETLARPSKTLGDDGLPEESDAATRMVPPALQQQLQVASVDRFMEESAPAVELSDDDLIEEEDDEDQDVPQEEETVTSPVELGGEDPVPAPIGQETGERLFPPADEAYVDPFSGEVFSVTDSMMEELPDGKPATPAAKADPSMKIESRDEPPPPGLRTEHDLPLVERDGEAAPRTDSTDAASAEQARWRPPSQKDAGAGSKAKYQATLRLPSLDELPDDEEAPTMPLLRPSAPPAPQLKLDPLAQKPVSHEKAAPRVKPPPSSPQPPLRDSGPPPLRDSGRQPAMRGSSPRQPAFDPTRTKPVPRSAPRVEAFPPAAEPPEADFEEFGVEPASVPLQRPDPQPIPRPSLDPRMSGSGRQPTLETEGEPDPFALMTGAVADPSELDARKGRGRPASQQHPPIQAVPSEVSGNLMGMLAGDMAGGDPSFPSMAVPPSGPAPTMPAEDDIEAQLAAAGLAEPRKERGHGLRWFLVALIGLVIGGGGLFGYLWYRSYKYVQGEIATLRAEVHTSTPEGFRKARKAAERILAHKKTSPMASAALAMCDAAMSIEFGDDRLKQAREELEASKGVDSEWRTAANAFLALMDDPERAAGYLQKGLEVYPDSALLHYLKGRALAASGDPERAGESFQAALKSAPNFVAAKVYLAMLVGQSEDRMAEAVNMLDEVLQKDPGNVQALIERARLRARHGKELSVAADDARRVTGDLAEKAGKGQVGWAHLVLAQVARQGGQLKETSAELDQAAQSPPCCDSTFAFELAGEMMRLSRMADAHAQMQRALELKPKKAEFLQRMARVLLELDDPGEAATYLERAPARQLETRLLQGRLFYAQHRYKKAIDQLKRVLVEKPDSVEAEIALALALARRKADDEAVRRLEKLGAAHPRDHEIFNALAKIHLWGDRAEKCHAALKRSWAITKLDPATPTIAGHMYLRQHDYGTARKRFERALQIRPEFRSAHLGLARLDLLAGDVAAAKATLRKIVPLEQKRWDVYAMNAEVELAEGSTSAAQSSLSQAEAAGAPKAVLARVAGEVAMAQKKPAEAVEKLQDAAKRTGKDAEILVLLARAQRQAGKIDDAYDTFHNALREDPGNPEALLGLARIAVRDGEFFVALKRCNDAIAKVKERGRPQSLTAEAHTVLGMAYLRKGDTGRAITNLQDAIDLDPNAAEPNLLMGQTYDKLDRPQRAVGYYDKAIKLDPALDEAYYFLAKAYAKSGDAAQAVRYFQDYLNRNPPAARAQEVAREIKRLGGG